jgi:hypothetical protein
MTVQHLIAKEVAATALRAYDEGRLGLCFPELGRCLYKYPPSSVGGREDCGCAIGVSLTDALPDTWGNKVVGYLETFGGITTDDIRPLTTLQFLHDEAVRTTGDDRQVRIDEFLAVAREMAS